MNNKPSKQSFFFGLFVFLYALVQLLRPQFIFTRRFVVYAGLFVGLTQAASSFFSQRLPGKIIMASCFGLEAVYCLAALIYLITLRPDPASMIIGIIAVAAAITYIAVSVRALFK